MGGGHHKLEPLRPPFSPPRFPTPDLAEEAKKASFELTLEAGDYDLEAWFANGKKRFGALWVYVKKL